MRRCLESDCGEKGGECESKKRREKEKKREGKGGEECFTSEKGAAGMAGLH